MIRSLLVLHCLTLSYSAFAARKAESNPSSKPSKYCTSDGKSRNRNESKEVGKSNCKDAVDVSKDKKRESPRTR